MLNDIFSRRYETNRIWDEFGERERRFLVQMSKLITEQLFRYWQDGKENEYAKNSLQKIHDNLSMELGADALWNKYYSYDTTVSGNTVKQYGTNTIAAMVKYYLMKEFDATLDPDTFIKNRISLVELAFRERGDAIATENAGLARKIIDADNYDKSISKMGVRVPGKRRDVVINLNKEVNETFERNVGELNERFRQAKFPLRYHNGFVQIAADQIIETSIEEPFWKLVADPQWANVDHDMKEALDLRDSGGRDPAYFAAKALESTIKIISNKNGWSTGKEKGAHNYIDNLVAERSDKFISGWEQTELKAFFTNIRNPLGHGPGDGEMPSLTPTQTDWAIEACMSWIKSLITRIQ